MEIHVLFLCTGNSARSIMAEAYLNHAGRGRWRAFSAGSKPVGAPNPLALETLKAEGVPIGEKVRSKSWDEFSGPGAQPMDWVITVCDSAAAETCPVWPKQNGAAPKTLHWSFPDPAAKTGAIEEKRAAFADVFSAIKEKISEFLEAEAQ